MEESTRSSILPRLLHEKKMRTYMIPVLLILALAAFLSTTAVLSQNAEALTKKSRVLDCHYHIQTGEGYAGYVVHVHTEDCCDAEGELVCKLPEIPAHRHGESCWRTEEVLVCTREESDGHAHDESCYGLMRGDLVCNLDEAEGHAHDESCYGLVRGDLVCNLDEAGGHAHDESCYGPVRGGVGLWSGGDGWVISTMRAALVLCAVRWSAAWRRRTITRVPTPATNGARA